MGNGSDNESGCPSPGGATDTLWGKKASIASTLQEAEPEVVTVEKVQ